MIVLPASGGNLIGLVDVAFGTVWYAVVPGLAGVFTRITSLQIDNAGTDNGLYLMRPLGSAVIQQAQTTADSTVILDRDPSASGNTIASGDQCVILFADGTYRRVQVLSWSASTLTLTLTTTLPAAISADTILWNFGVFTDTEPTTSLAFPKLDTPVSVVKDYSFGIGFGGWNAGDPLLIYCPNATAKTKLNYGEFARTTG